MKLTNASEVYELTVAGVEYCVTIAHRPGGSFVSVTDEATDDYVTLNVCSLELILALRDLPQTAPCFDAPKQSSDAPATRSVVPAQVPSDLSAWGSADQQHQARVAKGEVRQRGDLAT